MSCVVEERGRKNCVCLLISFVVIQKKDEILKEVMFAVVQ